MCEYCNRIKDAKTRKIVYDLDCLLLERYPSLTHMNYTEEDLVEMELEKYKYCPKCGSKIE